MTYIYCLTRNEVPFYIGRTKDLYNRMKSHKCTQLQSFDWFELDSCENNGSYLGSFYINLFRFYGYTLENKCINLYWYKKANIMPVRRKKQRQKATKIILSCNSREKCKAYLEEIKAEKYRKHSF